MAHETTNNSPTTEFIRRLSSSQFNYWAGYAVNISLVLWLVHFGVVGNLNFLAWVVGIAEGLALWTLVEYIMHRWLYHEVPSFFTIGHGLHHDSPKSLLGVPWYLSTIVLVAMFYLLSAFLSPAKTGVVMGFTWLGYIGYCFMHHSIHHFDFKNAWFKTMRRHHLYHHVHPKTNWGMVSTFWDHVFRTYVK